MKFWYFKFEGIFTANSTNSGYGVFSGCLLPVKNYYVAKKLFLSTLKESEIHLVEIMDYFSIEGEKLDPEDNDNLFWIEWYKETHIQNKPVFDTWHLFKLDKETN